MKAVYVHDAAALAAVVDPTLFDWEAGAVVVVTDGPAKGRTIRDEGMASLPALHRLRGLISRACTLPGCRAWKAGKGLPLALAPVSAASSVACLSVCCVVHCTYGHVSYPSSAGRKNWVGSNEWQGQPAVKVALGVRSAQLVSWVLDRMAR